MRRLVLGLALVAPLVLGAPAALAQGAAGLFVILYRQGPAWDPALSMAKQPVMARHGAYMKRLFDDGVSFAAGPTTDSPGGVVILRAASLEAAKALLADDPPISSGMFVGEVHPWAPAFRSDRPLP